MKHFKMTNFIYDFMIPGSRHFNPGISGLENFSKSRDFGIGIVSGFIPNSNVFIISRLKSQRTTFQRLLVAILVNYAVSWWSFGITLSTCSEAEVKSVNIWHAYTITKKSRGSQRHFSVQTNLENPLQSALRPNIQGIVLS